MYVSPRVRTGCSELHLHAFIGARSGALDYSGTFARYIHVLYVRGMCMRMYGREKLLHFGLVFLLFCEDESSAYSSL